MRKIKEGSSYREGDDSFLERINELDCKRGDLVTWEKKDYYILLSNGDDDQICYRVPPEHVWKSEPEIGDIIDAVDCPRGWEVQWTAKNGEVACGIIGAANILSCDKDEEGRPTYAMLEDDHLVTIMSKGTPEKSTLPPKIGDTLSVGKCKVGWVVELLKSDEIKSDAIGSCKEILKFESVLDYKRCARLTDGMLIPSRIKVKLISKGSDHDSVKRTKDSLEYFREATEGKTPDEKIIEHCCESGLKVKYQLFNIPAKLLSEMLSEVDGLPDDAEIRADDHKLVMGSDDYKLVMGSVEFNDLPSLRIIPNGRGGWCVEGTTKIKGT